MYIRRMKIGTSRSFKWLEIVNDASRNADAQHRVAKNPLQLCQHNPLIFRCLHVCHAIWLKTVGFGQTRYRKFSGVCGWRANLVPIPVRWHRHVRRWLQDPWTYSDVHLQASI